MATLVTRLHDVEQQLWRASTAVKLHLSLIRGLMTTQTPPDDRNAVSELMRSIQLVQTQLDESTTEMLSIVKSNIDSWAAGDETETEDEGMEDVKMEPNLKSELPAATSSSTAAQSGRVDQGHPMQLIFEVQPSESDTARHQGISEAGDLNVKPAIQVATGETNDVVARFAEAAATAKQLLVEMNMPIVDISTARAFSNLMSAADTATAQVLQRGSGIEEHEARRFISATQLMTSAVCAVPRHAVPYAWLEGIVGELAQICITGIWSIGEEELTSLYDSQSTLHQYLSNNYVLESDEAPTLVFLQQCVRRFEIQKENHYSKNPTGPILSISTKLAKDMDELTMKYPDKYVVRTEDRWKQFKTAACALARWMGRAIQQETRISPVIFQDLLIKLLEFDEMYLDRLPPSVLRTTQILADLEDKSRKARQRK